MSATIGGKKEPQVKSGIGQVIAPKRRKTLGRPSCHCQEQAQAPRRPAHDEPPACVLVWRSLHHAANDSRRTQTDYSFSSQSRRRALGPNCTIIFAVAISIPADLSAPVPAQVHEASPVTPSSSQSRLCRHLRLEIAETYETYVHTQYLLRSARTRSKSVSSLPTPKCARQIGRLCAPTISAPGRLALSSLSLDVRPYLPRQPSHSRTRTCCRHQLLVLQPLAGGSARPTHRPSTAKTAIPLISPPQSSTISTEPPPTRQGLTHECKDP
jgi:hypothetical protein